MDADTPPPGGSLPTSPAPAGGSLDPAAGPGRVLVIYSHGERREWIINSRTETPLYTLYSVTPRKDSTP